ncbi:hypothetical protein BV22DRAFT_1119544 [Leucogyrophana mollusca]|uniref:Uncharacterized protein n=1 Tax=Leucogyrophana mollusca TaxID=85980 RepID=A0ACB8BKT0_9AGAM|nr:hypothetical protein BV22DRAFT_1119544 [Leucogyrophana mollusca]
MPPSTRIASTSRIPPAAGIPRVDSPRPLSSHLVPEAFKPKHPHLDTIREPWVLDLQSLAAATSEARRDVVLVLGEPSLRDLQPVLDSVQLACSLVIIASHKPPVIPGTVLPAICFIRLNAPLAGSSSSRLMKTLDGAERLSRLWRKDGGSGVREITESENDTDPMVISANFFRRPAPPSAAPSLSSSSDGLQSSNSRRKSQLLTKAPWGLSKTSLSPPSSSVDPLQRAFDAILNYMPPIEGRDRMAILSHAILLSGVARSYLVSASPALPSQSVAQSPTKFVSPPTPAYASRDSFQTSSLTTASSTMSPLAKARLLYIVHNDRGPFARWLSESIKDHLHKLAHQGTPKRGGLEQPASYVMPVTALSAVVYADTSPPPSPPHTDTWSVADIVLCGALDSQTSPGELPYSTPRAWIGGADDFAFADIHSLSSLIPPSPSASLYTRERLRDSGANWNPMHMYTDDQSSTNTGTSTPPLVAPFEKALRRPVVRVQSDLPTPPYSDESGSISDHSHIKRRRSMFSSAEKGKGVEGSMVSSRVDEKGVIVGKRMRWWFWTSRGRAVTQ